MIFVGRDAGGLEGRYSNHFKVGHNAFEFPLDFGQFYPENGHAQLHTRIVTSPIYVKSLLETPRESIEQYEQTFGGIQEGCGKDQGTWERRLRKQPGASNIVQGGGRF